MEHRDDHGGQWLLRLGARLVAGGPATVKPGESPLFYVIPAEADKPPPGTVPLYEFRDQSGRGRYYSPVEEPRPGFKRVARPLGRVWKNPSRLRIW